MTTATGYAPAPEDRAAYDLIEHGAPAVTLRLTGPTGATFAKNEPDMVRGIAVLKPGTFHGQGGSVTIDADDLEAYVHRFDALRGVLRPPLRLDHSTSVMSVIGRYESLRVEDRVDVATGERTPMLVGDVRLNGTDEENARIRTWIARGKLEERSSELFPYETNAGTLFSSIFAGAAFVDIPAVEGLGAITLRRATLAIDRNTEQGDGIVPETTEPIEDAATEPTTSEPTTTPTTVEDPTPSAPAEEPAPDAPVIGDDPEPAPTDPEDDQPVGEVPGGTDLRAVFRAAGVQLDEVTLRRIERTNLDLVNRRVELAARLDRFTSKGVIPSGLRTTAEALLAHDDKAVRDGFAAYLDHARPPVALKAETGTQTSVAPGGARDGHIALTMTREEVEATYEAATPEQRRTHLSAELKAWQDARPAQQ